MIYAFIGLKGSGKTTACDYLRTKLPGVEQLNFKTALIAELERNFPNLLAVLRERYNMTNEELFTNKPPEVRALMMNYGTEVRRGDDPNYWVMQWKLAVAGLDAPIVLTDDVRFVNEYDAVKAWGGVTIRLNRADLVNTDTHQSETEQAGLQADFTIECEKDNLEKLYTELDAILVKCGTM